MNHELIENMFSFAEQAHRGQTRSGGHAYICHPVAVMLRVRDITNDAVVLAAALGHDLLEDCEVTEQELRSRFGDEVTDLIVELTNDYPDQMEFEAKLLRESTLPKCQITQSSLRWLIVYTICKPWRAFRRVEDQGSSRTLKC